MKYLELSSLALQPLEGFYIEERIQRAGNVHSMMHQQLYKMNHSDITSNCFV